MFPSRPSAALTSALQRLRAELPDAAPVFAVVRRLLVLAADGTWGPPRRVGTAGGGIDFNHLDATIDSRGDAIVTWCDTNHGTGAAVRAASSGWQPPRVVSRRGFEEGVAATPRGPVVVFLLDQDLYAISRAWSPHA